METGSESGVEELADLCLQQLLKRNEPNYELLTSPPGVAGHRANKYRRGYDPHELHGSFYCIIYF